ncbi:MAG TPA: cation:proton antiporter subunit C [bacterium]|nr:cation:proton antiporter subunit C [bacterium]
MVYGLCVALFLVGLYGVLAKSNLLKIVIGLAVMEAAAILFIVMLGYNTSGGGDPVAHELALVATVVGIAVIGVAVALARRLRAKHGTYEVKDLNRYRE